MMEISVEDKIFETIVKLFPFDRACIARTMDEKDKHDSQSENRRSVFDFSSVEDLRETDSDLVPPDKTQPKIPFNKSYTAHAPSRHLFTLNSRYTYFGGYGASSKDFSGSVEDLTGYSTKQKRNLSLSKFSKSSPDLFDASYQYSNRGNVTEQETDDFVRKLDIQTNLEKESEHRSAKLRLETKWATKTENEAHFQLSTSMLKLDNASEHTSFSSEAMNEVNVTASTFEGVDKTDERETTTHVQHPGANDADVLEIQKNIEKKSESFDTGWKSILHSGKAELKKSLENLNSFRQGMNFREIQNVGTLGSERRVSADSVELQHSIGEGMIMDERVGTKDYETGVKRNDEMAGLNMDDLIRNDKRQKVSQENVDEIFCQDTSSSCVPNTAVNNKQINYSGITTKDDSRSTTSYEEERCTTNRVITDRASTTREATANGNEEKQAALSIINYKNENVDLSTSNEEQAADNELCSSSDMKMLQTNFNTDRSTSKTPRLEANYSSNFSTYNSTVVEMEEMVDVPQATDNHIQNADKTINSEESSETIIPLSCSISPISFRVLNTSNSFDENIVWQNTEEFGAESTNVTVKVSESSICMIEDDKTTVDGDHSLPTSCINKPKDNWLNNNPYGGSFETSNKTNENPQTIEEEKQAVCFDDCNEPLSNSTHKYDSNWLTNTGTEKAKGYGSPKETADNSLIKNMSGMFCLLGLKDSPDGNFYTNGQGHYREQETEKDSSSVKTPKDINKKLFTCNDNEGCFEEQESPNGRKAESPINWEQHNKEHTAVDKVKTFGDKNTIQQITLYERPRNQTMFDKYISDVVTALDEKLSGDKDLLLNSEPDKTLRVSDIEQEKQGKAVQHRKTEGNDEAIILQTAMTQDTLLRTPEDSEGNSEIQNELGDFQAKEEIISELNMRGNNAFDFSLNTADLLTTSKENGLTQESTKEQNLMITTTNLEINRNKWSHALIIRTMNPSKRFSEALNVLVLDNELIPTSPERKQTVVTLNFFAHETEGHYSRSKIDEVSQVHIQMNKEKFTSKVDDGNSGVLQEVENEDINDVEQQVIQSNQAEDNLECDPVELETVTDEHNSENQPTHGDYTKQLHQEISTPDLETICYKENEDDVVIISEIQQPIIQTDESTTNKTLMGNAFEKSLPHSGDKETNETINDPVIQKRSFTNMQPDYFSMLESENPVQETVHKEDIKGMKDKRLSEHLMSFEMDELVEEKIPKQEKMEHENLFTELDGVFLPGNEVQETITKGETRGVQYELFSEVDKLFTSEEGMEEQAVVKCLAENNNVMLSQDNEVSLSEFTTQKSGEKTQHLNDSFQSEQEVPEVITKTINDRSPQHNFLSQFDKVLKPQYVKEIVPNKLDAQHDKQDYFLETDKYFDSLKNVPQTITQKIHDIQFEQSFELPRQRTDRGLPTKNVEKSVVSTLHLISLQNNEVDQADKDRNDSTPCVTEQNVQEDTWEITYNDQEALPTKEVESMSTKDTRVTNQNNEEIILVISHPMRSIHLYDGENHPDDDTDCGDDVRQCTASPIPDDLSSVLSNYDASAESSSAESTQNGAHQRNGEDSPINDDVPWDVTVSYSNPDTMKSEYKILRASYSNIQPEVYKVESQTADIKVIVDGKYINSQAIGDRNIPTQDEISEQLQTSRLSTVNSTENISNTNIQVTRSGGTLLDEGNQYITTMDIVQNRNQVSASYVLFQRFGKPESPKTYFELNYDVDKWKMGETSSCDKEEDSDKTFVVSYATIEQVNHSQVASPLYLPTIEEDEIYEDIYDNQAAQLSNEGNKVGIEFLQSSPASPPHRPTQSQSPALPPPPPPPLSQTSSSPPSSPPPLPPPPPLLLSQTSPSPSPPPPLPITTEAGTLGVQEEKIILHTVQYSPENLSPENMSCPLLPPPATNTQEIEQERSHHSAEMLEAPERYPLPQKPPPTLREDVQLVEIEHNLQQEATSEIPYQPADITDLQLLPSSRTEDIEHVEINHHLPVPLEILPEDLPYESSRTIQSQVPLPVSETRPLVWSFAQSVFHTDGQSKTFFKVIDNRNKSFQSSTFMYRGERIKVSRKVNVFKNYTEQDIDDEKTMDSRINEDYEGYSEIWDDGNLTPGNVLALYFISGLYFINCICLHFVS